MFLFKETLEHAGMADTRTQKLAEALNLLHSAISQCDLGNRKIFADNFPYAVRSAVEYAKIEELNQDLWGNRLMPAVQVHYDALYVWDAR